MKRSDLAHLIRALARIARNEPVIVIGSQSVLATFAEDELPEAVTLSMEADVAFLNDPTFEKSDKAEAVLGELSQFHLTFGYYLQSVSVDTAILPAGWRMRLVKFEHADFGDGNAVCLDVHDAVLAKLVANRPKDHDFARELISERFVFAGILVERAAELPVPAEVRERVVQTVERYRPAA